MIALLLCTALAQTPAAPPPPTLDAAFERQYALLKAEHDALAAELATANASADAASARHDATIAGLESNLASLQAQADAARAALDEALRTQATEENATSSLASAWVQAQATLAGTGHPVTGALATDPNATAGWNAVFANAATALKTAGQIRRVDGGAFFDEDGTAITGALIHVGEIATFGEHEGKIAPLLPLGEGRLGIATTGNGATGAALTGGTPDTTMGLFLHEGRERRVEEYKARTWAETRKLGGVVGDAILLLGIASFSLIALRVLLLLWAGRGAAAVHRAVARVAGGDLASGQTALAGLGGVTAEVVDRLLQRPDLDRHALEDVAREAILGVTPRVERFGTTIVVFSTVAPLVGLLGTVSGIITTFEAITRFGNSDPKMLSEGISEALIATEFGLGVAIPSLLIGHLLLGWGEGVLASVENAALRAINALEDLRLAGRPPTQPPPAAPTTVEAL
jgi:biopolymer transport protein ExbB